MSTEIDDALADPTAQTLTDAREEITDLKAKLVEVKSSHGK